MLHVRATWDAGSAGPTDQRILKEQKMTDPNTADPNTDETPARTWTRMELPQRERPDGDVPDPFGFFTGSGDEEGL
ncbi:hypothetical protein BAB78_01165 [Mycobacteroides abscessus]|nr:hypothetical protein BAB78_01165 [Mycobacteroides abscessus]